MYVDPPSTIGPWLAETLPELADRVWWDADPPDDLALRVGAVWLSGIGGGATVPSLVSPTLDIEVYGSSIEQARAITAVVFDAMMLQLPNTQLPGCTVTEVGVFTYPGPQPYDHNDDLRHIVMAFGLTLQTVSAPTT